MDGVGICVDAIVVDIVGLDFVQFRTYFGNILERNRKYTEMIDIFCLLLYKIRVATS